MEAAGRPHRREGMRRRAAARVYALAAITLVLVAACTARGPTDPAGLVRAMLTHSAAAWNQGDLAGFVGDYAPESTTTFVSGGPVRHAFAWIRPHYAPTFAPCGRTPHASLRFS